MYIIILAHGTITADQNKAVLNLIANTDGVFQYSLDCQEWESIDATQLEECK